jgi:hypothetical protein
MIDLNEAGDGMEQTAPVWAVFGDLMSGLLGAFVLILVGVLVVQMDLVPASNQKWPSAARKSNAAWRWRKPWPFRWHRAA